jgi:glycosyltransferase involved in cell wall biosynthesis
MAEDRKLAPAHQLLLRLEKAVTDADLKALIANDLAALAALSGDEVAARKGFETALALYPSCEPARANLALLGEPLSAEGAEPSPIQRPSDGQHGPVKVAILSFLFNWPSTGGGIVHTVELAHFLKKAGYEIRHYYARHLSWGVGKVENPLPFASEALEFDDSNWNVPQIQSRFREAVDSFNPDYVIITDSWNSKPILAEAVRGYPYILRFQAMECLCPLNNVRLLADGDGQFRQCNRHQLATPDVCNQCLQERGQRSGSLHQAERALCGVGSAAYYELLLRTIAEAKAVLVVNPLHEAMMSPYAKSVHVVTAGMDPSRFPWPKPENLMPKSKRKKGVFFAGLVEETIKGFAVLHEACSRLWQRRQDFELVATGNPPGQVDQFTRFIGWQSQEDLPRHLQEADMLVMPTIAQEALGRTAVEAMAAGIPVLASRIGGLPFTVADGATGLLFEPGDADDLACKIETLLNDAEMCKCLGQAGRRRFEEHYSWDVIIERHYRPLLTPRRKSAAVSSTYMPVIPDRVDHNLLLDEVAEFFQLPGPQVETQYQTYRAFHEAKIYAQTLGERKTLCFEEAFVLYVLLAQTRPRTLVEIGTQFGKSARRILDMRSLLGLDSPMICFDVDNQVRHFHPGEAELIIKDVSGYFAREVLEAHRPGLIFHDVHLYPLLKEVVTGILTQDDDCVLVIHDCGRGLCNPHMRIAKDDPNVSSLTGIWERHVLAEIVGMNDPMSERLDKLETDNHRLRIFSTPHGLAILAPKRVLAKKENHTSLKNRKDKTQSKRKTKASNP